MRKVSFLFVFSICFLIVSSCAQKKSTVVTIKTSYGDMVAILYDDTPKHKENFIKLAKSGFYDGTLFHRVIEGFMIQGGDPDSKNAEPGKVIGKGGPGYTLDAEILPKYFHEKGSLSAARLGDDQNPKKASSGSQFYIVQGRILPVEEMSIDHAKYDRAMQKFFENPANKAAFDSIGAAYQEQNEELFRKLYIGLMPRVSKETGLEFKQVVPQDKLTAYSTVGGAPVLDGSYTVFGKVIKGLEIIDKITAVEKDQADRPVTNIPMTVTVDELSHRKIEDKYGYKFP